MLLNHCEHVPRSFFAVVGLLATSLGLHAQSETSYPHGKLEARPISVKYVEGYGDNALGTLARARYQMTVDARYDENAALTRYLSGYGVLTQGYGGVDTISGGVNYTTPGLGGWGEHSFFPTPGALVLPAVVVEPVRIMPRADAPLPPAPPEVRTLRGGGTLPRLGSPVNPVK